MFNLGELFVSFTGRDGGLANLLAAVAAKGSGLTSLFGLVMNKGGIMGTAVSGAFYAISTAAQVAWASVTMGITLLAAAGAAMGGLGAYAISTAGSFQEVKSKFDTVFKESAPQASAELDKLAKAVGRSKAQMYEMAANTQDLLVPLGFARDKAAGMSVTISQLAVDMASFGNKSDADAINDIQAAMTGSGEVMKKYGVVLNETTMKQELARMGWTGSAESASEQMKALARLNIIVKGTSDAHGDAVRTGGSFANQMKRIMGLVQDLAIKVGNVFLPAAEVFLQFFSDGVASIDENTQFIESWGATVKGWAETVVLQIRRVMVIFQNWSELSGLVWELIDAGLGDVEESIYSFGNDAWAILSALGNNMLSFFPNVLEAIGKAHGGLWQFIQKGWGEIWDYIRSGGRDAVEIGIDEIIKDVWSKVQAPIMPSASTQSKTEKAWQTLVTAIDGKLDAANKKAAELGAIKEFDKSLAGNSEQTKKIKFELVSATSLFTKNLESVFGDKEGEKLELMKKQVELGAAVADTGKKTLEATTKVVTLLEKPKALISD